MEYSLDRFQKPPIGGVINTGHPIIRGVGGLWYFDRGHDFRDRTNNTALSSVTGTPVYRRDGIYFDGASYLKYTYPSSWTTGDAPFTFVCSFLYNGTTGMLGGLSSAGWWGPQYTHLDGTNHRINFKVYGWSGQHYDLYSKTNGLKIGQRYTVVCTYFNTTMKIYLNGTYEGSQTTNGSSMTAGGAIPHFNIACNETSSNKLTGIMYYAMHFAGRALSDNEAILLSSDPYCFIYEQSSIDEYYVAAAGGGETISVPLATLSLATFAPTVSTTANNTVDVPLGTLSLTTFAPTVSATANNTVDVPLATLSLTAFAPTVTVGANNSVDVPLATLSLTTFAPTVSATANNTVDVPLGTLSLTTFAPTVSATGHNTVDVPLGTFTLTTFAPTVSTSAGNTVDVPVGSLTLTGYAPSVSATGNQTVSCPLGGFTLTTYAPTVTNGSASLSTSTKFKINPFTGKFDRVEVFALDSANFSGSFTSQDGKTVVVSNGIIVSAT